MKFTKMQGLGNDYVYVNCFEETVDNINEIAKKISDRHFGVGSDGLVLICPSDKADFRMDMYNSDGTQAEMCGNAIRCVAKYAHDRGLTDKTSISIETLAGIKTLELNLENGSVKNVRVNMGKPELVPKNIPIDSGLDRFIRQDVDVDGKIYKVTGVSMGNPHAVVFVDEMPDMPVLGPKFENHKLFPRRINTEFAKIVDRKTIKMRVWERGAGETLACGTGACATMVAARLSDFIGNEADIVLLGGTLHIEWDGGDVFMTGPCEFVFDGNYNID
ncbi:MAG: diaminopimelate epimerase [Firmicutes bacterium]|nr:diaminopimelate epimerase [Bacillota bacterium]